MPVVILFCPAMASFVSTTIHDPSTKKELGTELITAEPNDSDANDSDASNEFDWTTNELEYFLVREQEFIEQMRASMAKFVKFEHDMSPDVTSELYMSFMIDKRIVNAQEGIERAKKSCVNLKRKIEKRKQRDEQSKQILTEKTKSNSTTLEAYV